MTKSFTSAGLLLYFNLLMILNAKEKECCFRDIEEYMIDKGLISYDNISSKTIERKLNEMCKSLGILKYRTIKRTNIIVLQRIFLKK